MGVLRRCDWYWWCASGRTRRGRRGFLRGRPGKDFIFYEWVDLHSGEESGLVVVYLKGLLDKEGVLIDDECKECRNQKLL